MKRASWVTWSATLSVSAWLAWAVLQNQAGANPVEFLLNETGSFSLYALMLCLAITPVRMWTALNWVGPYRRELGLSSAWFALSHFLIYLVLEQGLDVSAVVADAVKRPFIFLGLVAVVLMLPLVATSFKKTIRMLGPAKWKILHRLSYAIGVLAVAHFWLKVKIDITEPAVWACVLLVLFALRAVKNSPSRAGSSTGSTKSAVDAT